MRPFINSRSTTLGSNRFSFHTSGNGYSSFEFLKGSISDMMLNQIWGFQMTGADICGYGGDAS